MFTLENSVEKQAIEHRRSAQTAEPRCTWSGQLPQRQHKGPTYSPKVFLGGIPWDINEADLVDAFSRFGTLQIIWPNEPRSRASPNSQKPGYVYIVFENDKKVKELLASCTHDYSSGGKWYFNISSRKMKCKDVQVIPWVIADANHVRCPSQRLDPSKTVFVGALHGMLTAEGLAHVMNDLFNGVAYVGIDTDKFKYPIGSARVTFSNQKSYIKAVQAAFVDIKTPRFNKKIQIDPYLENSICSTCLVKDYLRELPEPLFTKALFEMMVDGLSVCLPDDPAGNAKLMFSILECLPKIDRCCVMFLMDHLKLVTKHSEKNKMTSQALAAIFGPLFTCSTESDNLHKSVEVFKFLLDIWPSRKGSILSRNASIDETVQSKDSSNSSNMPVTSSTVSSSNINNTSAAHSAAASIVSKAAPHGPSRSLQQQQQMQGSSLYTSASMPVHSVTSSGIDSLPVTTLTPGASPTALEPMMSPTDGQPTPSVQPRPRVSVYGQDNAPHNVQSSQSMVHSTTKKSVAWASGPSSTGTPTTRILLGNTGLSQGSHQGAPANLNNRS
ncbi:Cytoplasmic polyadenylation element-binding protein 1 [Halotydeus destructor]|nr:Cytoplasmic polyadenylation element-binding protein 1 [Halotydeus destructor]